jgi:hypothetical protein
MMVRTRLFPHFFVPGMTFTFVPPLFVQIVNGDAEADPAVAAKTMLIAMIAASEMRAFLRLSTGDVPSVLYAGAWNTRFAACRRCPR